MHSAFFILLLFILFALLFIGFFLNGFILTKSLINWLKGKRLQAIDMIIASLGLLRIVFLVSATFMTVVFVLGELMSLFKRYYPYIVTTQVFVELCSLWWGAVLCVFYCLKINNYSGRLFIKLKMRISGMVPWLLLGSMMVSLLSSLPCRFGLFSFQKMNSTRTFNGTSSEDVALPMNYEKFHIIYMTGSLIPFLIFCVATFFQVVPLFKHTRKMNINNRGFTKGQLDVHLRAIRNMLSFLIFYVLGVINGVLLSLGMQLGNISLVTACCLFLVSYPSLHSILLIDSNVKLRKSFTEILHCFS